MLQRSLLYGVVMLILLGLAISAGQWDKDTTLLQQHADEISAYIKKQAEEADAWSKQNLNGGSMNKTDFSALLNGQEQAFTVVIHEQDSVLLWSNNKIIPNSRDLALLQGKSGFQILNLSLGWFAAKSEAAGTATKTILIPIRYGVANISMFPASKYIPSNVHISAEKTPYEIMANGKALAWVKSTGSVQAAWLQWVKLLAWSLFLFTLIAAIHHIASALSAKRGVWVGGSVVVASVIAITLFNGITGFTTQQFGALPAFSQQFEHASFIGRSLGDWLLHIFLLIWVMVFIHQNRPQKEDSETVISVNEGLAIGTSTGAYLLIMGCMLIAAEVFRQLIFHSTLIFDFDNLLGMGSLGVLALAGMVAFMVAMFLFSHRMALVIKQLHLERNKRLIAFGLAGVTFSVLAFLLSGMLSPFYLIVFALIYALMFDAYVHWDSTGFGWVLCWLLLFSMFSSSLLYRYNKIKDSNLRISYAKNLVETRDTSTAEKILPLVVTALRKDTQALGNLLKPWPFKARKSEINAVIYQQILQYEYLFQHYRPEINAFDKERQSIIVGQPLDYAGMEQYWSAGKPVSGTSDLRSVTDETGKFAYIAKLNTLRMGDPTQPAQVYVAFRHEYPSATNTYARMFFQAPYKGMDQLSRYDFAVRNRGQLVVEQGLSNPGIWNTNLEKGKTADVTTPELGRSDALSISPDGLTMATVGRTTGAWYKQVYLFALLFSLATILLFSLSFVNAYLHFLPAEYNLRLSTNGSLAKRIHFWNIMLLAVSFVVVGYLTYRHFNRTYEENERSTIDYKSQAMLLHLKARTLSTNMSGDSLNRVLPQYLNSIATSLSSDANLYSKEGNLVYTTQEELAHIGLIPSKMNATAWAALHRNAQVERSTLDQTAGVVHSTKYLSLHNGQNQLLGFIGVPYLVNGSKIGPEVSDFIGMLASLYVFLLLIAFVVTFALSRSIIRPLRLLSENVKSLRLEDKNIPLQYSGDSQDEVSELIVQYNNMVGKLEASKIQMVRLEREGAWREMARQVAHDIKNPLTTMKLSMQQLERVSNNPEQAAAYLRKAITRLIEQIDSLAQIASEFSMFANLEIKNKSEVVVNEVVENVHDLFSEHKNVNLDLQLPTEKLSIMGDKNHLIRVFNNLIINAIQAIPSDRRGVIHVSVYRKAESAEIKISDNGGGIPPEIRDRVFEPNFTTKTSGSGLGLAICKKIIEGHDGDMRFETRDNEGTDFFVEIPLSSVGLQLKFP